MAAALQRVVEQIKPLRGRNTVILATGDPMNYGVARKLLEFVPFAEMAIIPHLSAFSLAAARMGWPLPDCDTLTLHGRAAANIEAFIQPGARLIALTADASTIAEVARRLVTRGFETKPDHRSREHGRRRAKQRPAFLADAVPKQTFSDLNTLAIECIAGPNAQIWSRVPGLPDDAFVHDGQLTKREVRAATLAALAPAPDALLWDVGAGCGSVAIEWMRADPGLRSHRLRAHEDRLTMIAENADRLGTPRLKIVAGEAPDTLPGSRAPMPCSSAAASAFPGVFETAWEASQARRPHGRQCRHARGRTASLSIFRRSMAAISCASMFRISRHIGPLPRAQAAHGGAAMAGGQAMTKPASSMAWALAPAIPNS